MNKIYTAIILFLSLSTMAQQTTESWMFDGEMREYIQYTPPISMGSENVPLVFCFHGLGDTMGNFYNIGMDLVADTANFIVVFPQALTDDLLGQTAWNSGAGFGGFSLNEDVDDVGFVMAMIDTLSANYNIDTTRIYATGFSMGGFMTNRLACEKPEVFEAMASVAGTIGEEITCQPSIPIRIAHFHGTADNTVGYETNNFGSSVPEWFTFWQSADECIGAALGGPLPDVADDGYTIDYARNGECEGGAEVVLYTVNGLAHEWLTPANDIFYTTEIWRFFLGVQPTLATGLAENRQQPLRVFPNPTAGSVTLELPEQLNAGIQVEFIDLAGRASVIPVQWQGQRAQLDLAGFSAGTYAVRVISNDRIYTSRLIIR